MLDWAGVLSIRLISAAAAAVAPVAPTTPTVPPEVVADPAAQLPVLAVLFAGLTLIALGIAAVTGAFGLRRIAGPRRLESSMLGGQWICVAAAGCAYIGLITAALLTIAAVVGEKPEQLAPRWALLATAAGGLLVVGLVWVLGWLVPGKPARGWGLGTTRLPSALWQGPIALLVAAWPVLLTLTLTQIVRDRLGQDLAEQHPVFEDMPAGGPTLWLVLFGAGVVVPFVEEFLFRGVLQTGLVSLLQRKLSPTAAGWLGVLGVSLPFALLHPVFSMPAIFVLSVAFGYVYERTGNLWSAVALHACFNSAMLGLSMLEGQHP